MKFKLDENFGTRTQQVFRDSGHIVQTVVDQSLQGASDQRLFEVICSEDFCLVTLDLGFANVLRYPPEKTHGLVVIRVPQNPSLELLGKLISQFLQLLIERSVEKSLWIVEVDRVRVHSSENN